MNAARAPLDIHCHFTMTDTGDVDPDNPGDESGGEDHETTAVPAGTATGVGTTTIPPKSEQAVDDET